jgi:PAS domain S-box-containing protein
MSPAATPQLHITIQHMGVSVRVACAAAVFVGAAVLVGWALDIAILTSVAPGYVTMKPNTAICFILSGVSLWLLRSPPGVVPGVDAPHRRAAHIGAGLVTLVGLATLSEYVFGVDLGIDDLLMPHTFLGPHTSHVGRMAPGTALSFAFLGGTLLSLDAKSGRWQQLSEFSALTVVLLGLLAVLGYAYGVESLYRISIYTSMALHTALLFVALGLGTLLARCDRGLMTTITSAYGGGLMARHVLPLALTLLFVFGWLRLQGERDGWYDTAFGLAMFALSNIITFVGLVWLGARALNRMDAERSQVHEQLAEQARVLDLAQVLVRDMHGRIVLWNLGAEKLYGFTKDDALGRISHELLHTEFPEPLAQIDATLLRIGVWEGELAHRTRDGQRIIVSSQWVVHRDAAGRPVRILEAITDISARKRVEDQLRAGEARFHLLVDGVQDYAIFMLDADGRVLTWNAGAERLKGYRASEIVGQSSACFYMPEDVAAAKPVQILQHAMAEGHAEDEGWRIRRDGSRFWANVVVTALRDEHGEILGFAKITRDLTDRIQAEMEQRRLLHVLESSLNEIYIFDAQTLHFAYVNRGAQRNLGIRLKSCAA